MGLPRSTSYEEPAAPADEVEIVACMRAICRSATSSKPTAFVASAPRSATRGSSIVVNGKKIRRLMRAHDLQPRLRGGSSPPPTVITIVRSSQTGPL
jgi:putative transposase